MSAVTVKNLYLTQIIPSTTNPRKSFDPVALEQLAESIKEIGVTVPVLVRYHAPNEDFEDIYELVSGHRRLKAAALADLETIPAFIRELTDAEVLDIQMVENLQRADLHPMDEAAGYQALIAASAERGVALTQEELAHKVGKPLSYVAQRVKLLDLTETPRKVFQEGHINLGHALILARLTPELQADGLRTIFDGNRQYAKIKDVAEVVEKAIASATDPKQYNGPREAARSVSQLKNWVKSEVELNLADAPWDLAAENLHPTATSCNLCPKRTGNNPALFSEMTTSADTCMDPTCFDVKTKTFLHITVTGPTLSGKPMLRLSDHHGFNKLTGDEKAFMIGQFVDVPRGSCKDAREGVMISGSDTGKIRWVCINQACKTHKHTVTQPREASATTASGQALPKGMTRAEYEEQQKLDKQREQAETTAIYQAIRNKAKVGSRDALLVNYVILSLDQETCTDADTVLELNGWMTPEIKSNWRKQAEIIDEKLRELKATAFNALIFDLSYGDLSDSECYRDDISKVVGDLMETYGVDEKAVVAAVKAKHPELYPVPKPKEEKPAKAKPAAKKAAKKGAKSKPTELSAEGKQRVADAIKKDVAARVKPTGKSAAAHDVDDEELDELADNLASTPANPSSDGFGVDLDDDDFDDEEDGSDFDDDEDED